MANEDFTLYTEVDENGNITVDDASQVSVAAMRADANSFLRSPSKGVDHFGDFKHRLKLTWSARTDGAQNRCGTWSLNNGDYTLAAQALADAGLAIFVYTDGAWHDWIKLVDYTNDNEDSYDIGVDQLPKIYWLEVERDGVGATLKIYPDDTFTDPPLDTLVIVCGALAYEFVNAITNYDGGGAAKVTLVVEDLNLMEGAAPQTLLPSAIASLEAFGTPGLAGPLIASGIASLEAFGTPVAAGPLIAEGIASAEAFGEPTLTLGAQTLEPSSIPSDEAFGTPVVAGPLIAVGIPSAEAFGTLVILGGVTGVVYPLVHFVLEVRKSDGTLVAMLENAFEVHPEEQVGGGKRSGFLTFKLPMDDGKCSHLLVGREIWLYEEGTFQQVYHIATISDIREPSGVYREVFAEQYLTKLDDFIVGTLYEPTAQTVTTILTELLSRQTGPNQITLGGVDAALNATITASFQDWDTLLRACLTVQEIVGGIVMVLPDSAAPLTRELFLKEALPDAEDKGQQIRYGKNLCEITREVDRSELVSKLYPRGTGVTLDELFLWDSPMDDDFDVTYGYLTLAAEYARYKGWTGAGDALPASMDVRLDGELYRVLSNDPPEGAYTWEGNVKYGKLLSMQGHTRIQRIYLFVRNTDPINDVTGMLYLSSSVGGANLWSGAITVPPTGANGAWVLRNIDADFAHANCFVQLDPTVGPGPEDWPALRRRDENGPDGRDSYWWDGGAWQQWAEDTNQYYVHIEVDMDFEQGADSKTLRCPVAQLESGGPYTVDFYHAKYLEADPLTDVGVVEKIKTNPIITETTTLVIWGRSWLTTHRQPVAVYRISMADLSRLTGMSFDRLILGSTIKVIDEELGIDAEAVIVRIGKPDLSRVGEIDVELSNVAPYITDTIGKLVDKTRSDE